MASLETSKPRRPGRKLTKRQREPGRIPMDLPERFKYDDDDDDQVHEEVAPKMESAPFMHQSVFGMIAAAQSKNDFRSAAQESDSESEEDCSRGAMGRDPPEELLLDTQRPVVLPDRSRHSKRLSDTSTSHTLSGLRPAPSRSMPKSAATRKTPLVQLSPLSSPAPASTPTATADATSRDVPVMSQMLEARAKADMDSSRATLIAPKSGEHSLSASTSSSHRASLQLPDALKDIFQFDEPEDVIAGKSQPLSPSAFTLMGGRISVLVSPECPSSRLHVHYPASHLLLRLPPTKGCTLKSSPVPYFIANSIRT